MAKKAKHVRAVSPYRAKNRFGIQNHVGGIWTPETFDTAKQAQDYLDKQRSGWSTPGGLDGHKVIPVRVTVSALKRGMGE